MYQRYAAAAVVTLGGLALAPKGLRWFVAAMPIITVLVMFGGLVVLILGTTVARFVYTLF